MSLETIAIITVAIFFILLIAIVCSVFSAYSNNITISEQDLDKCACEQMRVSGWSEEKIILFMAEHNSHYYPQA